MTEEKDRFEYGCVFLRSGCEARYIEELGRLEPRARALSPTKLRLRHAGGRPVEEAVRLFPGYVFFALPDDMEPDRLIRPDCVYRLLMDSEGDWRLKGADRFFAEGVFQRDGVFGFSKAVYIGDRIRVLEGPLKDCGGEILRVNRRRRTAEVRMDFQGVSMNVWLGFELIGTKEEKEGKET